MKSKSELFLEAANKNALRREAKLPLIDIKEEIEKLDHQQKLLRYCDGLQLFEAEIAAIRVDVLVEQKKKRGQNFGDSWGGRMALGYLATPYIRDFLAAKGYPWPGIRNPIIYGEHRSKPVEKYEAQDDTPDEWDDPKWIDELEAKLEALKDT